MINLSVSIGLRLLHVLCSPFPVLPLKLLLGTSYGHLIYYYAIRGSWKYYCFNPSNTELLIEIAQYISLISKAPLVVCVTRRRRCLVGIACYAAG